METTADGNCTSHEVNRAITMKWINSLVGLQRYPARGRHHPINRVRNCPTLSHTLVTPSHHGLDFLLRSGSRDGLKRSRSDPVEPTVIVLISVPRRLVVIDNGKNINGAALSYKFTHRLKRRRPRTGVLLLSASPTRSLNSILRVTISGRPHPLTSIPGIQIQTLSTQALLRRFQTSCNRVLRLLMRQNDFITKRSLNPF